MKIGIIQPPYPDHDMPPEKVVLFILEAIDRLATPLDLILLPEYANCPGRSDYDELVAFVARFSDGFISKIKTLARKKQTNIAVNALLAQSAGFGQLAEFRNTTLLIGRDGYEITRYEKTHLSATEKAWGVKPGNQPVCCRLEGSKVAFATCFEIYFAEYFERLAAMKPDILLFPSYQRSEDSEIIRLQTRMRALDIEAFILRASYRMGPDATTGGCSMVVDPMGSVLLDAGQACGLFICDISPDLKRLRPAAHGLPEDTSRSIVEKNRRPELYRPTVSALCAQNIGDYPRVIAHRGWSGSCPENTLPAFGAALALGVREIELDVWVSRDRELVVCHDPSIDRTSDRQGFIQDLTWPEIKAADAGRWFHDDWSGVAFCRLDDILSRFAGQTIMNIHIKAAGDDGWVIERVRDLVEAAGIKEQVYLAGEADVLAWAIKLAPDIERCCLEGQTDESIVTHAIKYGCQRLQFGSGHFNRAMIDQAHRAGMICNLFYCDDVSEARECFAMGIDAILTNHPNRILPLL